MLRSLSAGVLAGLLLAAAPKAPLAAQSLGITPYAGYMKFGNLMDGPFGTSVRGAGAPIYGAELQLGVIPGLALVGNVAYAKSNLDLRAPLIGGVSVGQNSALMYDAGLRLHLPLAFSPFVQAGAGAMRQEVSVASATTHSTNLAYNVGGGVDMGLAPGVGLQLMVKDYIGKFDAREATSLNLDTGTTHNWTVSAGLRLGL